MKTGRATLRGGCLRRMGLLLRAGCLGSFRVRKLVMPRITAMLIPSRKSTSDDFNLFDLLHNSSFTLLVFSTLNLIINIKISPKLPTLSPHFHKDKRQKINYRDNKLRDPQPPSPLVLQKHFPRLLSILSNFFCQNKPKAPQHQFYQFSQNPP